MNEPMKATSDARFSQCLTEILRQEGGYADHPADPGGATNLGITRKTLALWRKVTPWWALDKAEVKALGRDEAGQIYRAIYWNRCKGDALGAGIDLALFDYAVNSGPDRAIKSLQRQLDCVADGSIGPVTLAALVKTRAEEIIDALCNQRLGFLERLTSFAVFGRGWSRRVQTIRATAHAMAGTTFPRPTTKETDIMSILAGYRSYIVAALMLVAGICQLLGIDLPSLDGQSAGQLVMEAFAVIFLRRGIANEASKI